MLAAPLPPTPLLAPTLLTTPLTSSLPIPTQDIRK